MKWMAYEFREERKYKVALAYHCSRRIMKQTKQENIYNQELVLYHKLVSHEMADMVRSEFANISKENREPLKEIEADKMSIEIEINSAQNDVDVLDLDLELKQKTSNFQSNPGPISINNNNVDNNIVTNSTPILKKQAISLPMSNISMQSSKIRKKGTTTIKSNSLPIPFIRMQPLLIEYMKKMIDVDGYQTSDTCCLIDTSQTYENLVKLFKRFPKKTKHLKTNAPDIFATPMNDKGPNITPFEDSFKTVSANIIENSGQKKRKKTSFKEDGIKSAGISLKTNELKKGIDYLNFKKIRNPENFDEILTLFYNDHKISEGDYQKLFSNSV